MRFDVWQCFDEVSRHRAEHAALVTPAGECTYADLYDRAVAFGRILAAQGLRPRPIVLISMRNSPDMAAAILGTWRCGGIVALLHPDAPRIHLEEAIDKTDPVCVVVDPDSPVAQRAQDSGAAVLIPPFLAPDGVACEEAPLVVLPTDPASIVFTSGSTGRPKGVAQSHRNLIDGCRAVGGYLGYRDDDRILGAIPWTYDYGFGQLLSTLILGITQILPEQVHPLAVCEAIERHRPSVLPGIPSSFAYLLRGVSPFRQTDLSSVRLATNTGGTIPADVFTELLDLLGDAEFVLNYGLTETYRSGFLPAHLTKQHPTSIGRGIPGVHLAVVRDDDTIASPGEVGQIVHRGAYVCLGYWGNPQATEAALRRDPLIGKDHPPGSPVFYTGDMGYTDETGLLYFHGRRDRQLKCMGVRVSPREIEEILLTCDAIEETAVFGLDHEILGKEIWAAVVASAGPPPTVPILNQFAMDRMSPYMQPRKWLMVGSLPKTHTGKTDYPALEQMAGSPIPHSNH